MRAWGGHLAISNMKVIKSDISFRMNSYVEAEWGRGEGGGWWQRDQLSWCRREMMREVEKKGPNLKHSEDRIKHLETHT